MNICVLVFTRKSAESLSAEPIHVLSTYRLHASLGRGKMPSKIEICNKIMRVP